MRKFLFLIIVIAAAGLVQDLAAQDTIYKVNHDLVAAKIVEIGTSDIKYKRSSAPEGPLYVVRKTDVWKIVYADGTVEYYNQKGAFSAAGSFSTQRPWSVSINSFDLMFSMISITPEYHLGNSGASLRIPLSVGLSGKFIERNNFDGNYYNRNKLFSAGLNLLFYPAGRNHIINYYLGAAGEFGMVERAHYDYTYVYPYETIRHLTAENYAGCGMVNGVQMQITDRMNINFDMTLGMHFGDSRYFPLCRFAILMGWRFGAVPQAKPANQK